MNRGIATFLCAFLACAVSSNARADTDSFSQLTATLTGKMGSPVNGGNGKVYVADSSNSRLAVITVANDAVSFVALPGQPMVDGGALSVSKDKTRMAIPLNSGKISVLNLANDTLIATYDTAGNLPDSTAFGSTNNIIFFSTTDSFDDIYVLDTAQAAIVNQFGLTSGLDSTGSDIQLDTNAAGTVLYALERFGSPGGLNKINVANPLAPAFVAEDDHGDLGSNCRGLAVIPGGVAPPSQGHEAYIACGFPYYVQGISQSGSKMLPGTHFETEPYPTAVDTLSNGDVVAMRDSGGQGYGAFVFTSGGTFKKGWAFNPGIDFITSDGLAAVLLNDQPKLYVTTCGISYTEANNCVVHTAGAPANENNDGNDGESDDDISVEVNKSSFPNKGGTLTVTATVDGTTISNVTAKLKKGARVVKTSKLTSTGEDGEYRGNLTVPKNTTAKVVTYVLSVSATASGETVTADDTPITVAKAKKKKK